MPVNRMNAAVRVECPKCRRKMPEEYRRDDGEMTCPHCQTDFEFFPFPALFASPAAVRAASVSPGEATCFFHEANRADAVCEGCGRFVCTVCSVDFGGRKLCPGCLENRGRKRNVPENHRVLYDGIALALAIVPILFWPFTLVTAPLALGVAIHGWNKPGSVVHGRRRFRLALAMVCSVMIIGGWGFAAFTLIFR